MSKIQFHPQAQKELWDAIDWYLEIDQKITQNFEIQINRQLERIQEAPQQFPTVFRGIKRAKIRKFPFSILFETFGNDTFILAVFHESRNPEIWKERQGS